MTALFFICLVACLFACVVMFEARGADEQRLQLGTGLLRWLTGGNWTAKLGGGLLVVGVGALLRYALVRIEVAPPIKLAGGVAISSLLFVAAHLVRSRIGRRDIAVAFAGAGFGVAYLTAYSAYALFHYLGNSVGLTLLAVVAVGAGAYAVLRRTLSIALLAMFGAFLAPAFAIDQPTPAFVYGYYIAISQLTLIMVAMRGWRALIHLSFLFTLGGGVFFAWTAGFYSPEHFETMRPLLLALIAIHLAMPIVEQRTSESLWRVRFDRAYFIALPAVGAALLMLIAPDSMSRSDALILLGCLWAGAAMAIAGFKLNGALQHGLVAALFTLLALYVRVPQWPWLLIAQGLSVAALFATLRSAALRKYQDVAATSVLVTTGVFVAQSISTFAVGLPFANPIVLKRIASGLLLVAAWRIAIRLNNPLSRFFGWASAIVLSNTVVVELYRCDIVSLPLALHALLIATALILTAAASRRAISKSWIPFLSIAMVLTGLWAAPHAGAILLAVMLLASPAALVALAIRSTKHESDHSNGDRILAMCLVPFATWIWANASNGMLSILSDYFALALAALSGLAAIAFMRTRSLREAEWTAAVMQIFEVAFGVTLLCSTSFFINKSLWSITLDLVSLAAMFLLTSVAVAQQRSVRMLYSVTALGSALVAQALLLRALGPDVTMTIADVFDLKWPAVISLFWSALGAVLTIVARRVGSRALWSTGALVLVGCAAKLILLDFGSLGELTNILAVIGAGLVFLLVSWLSPLPPKESAEVTSASMPRAR